MKRLAKLGQEPGLEWPKLPIQIIRRDCENYDRCSMDVYRKEMGKNTLTSSENELDKPRVNRKTAKSETVLRKENPNKKERSYTEYSNIPSFDVN